MVKKRLSNSDIILLSLLKGIGAKRLLQLVPMIQNINDLNKLSLHDWKTLRGVNPKTVCADLKVKQSNLELKKRIRRSLEFADHCLSYWDEAYPPLLKQLYQPPPFIFCKGNIKLFEKKSVAIVGSRKMTSYGKEVSAKLSTDVSKNNITVVSGFAQGVDTVAHREALKYEGNSIAVLGSGLNRIYPKTNAKLYQEFIERGGLIVSEFLIDTKPDAMNFPKRNRIIAGLSSALIVTEAHKKSGALITAEFSLENNRDVFAVPGSILSEASKGSNELIKQGATPYLTIEDFLKNLKWRKQKEEKSPTQLTLFQLNKTEEKILDALTNRYHIDDLALKLDMPIYELSTHLLNLEINQLVLAERGQFYLKT
jgi:DNA processing protein